jgi:Zn-dependent protease/CBS domain-containing protein
LYETLLLVSLVFAVFSTVVLHELGHVIVAGKYGCNTKDIMLLPIGGVARLDRMPEKPLQEIAVALAGPAVNLAIAVIIYLSFFMGDAIPVLTDVGVLTRENWVSHFYFANLALAVFNLVPAFPMDGGRVLRGVLGLRMEKTRATVIAARIGQSIATVMFIAGLFFNPFLAFIGLFIFVGAQLEATATMHQRLLHGYTAIDVAMHRLVRVNASDVLRDVADLLLDTDATRFVVEKNGEPVGYLDRELLLHALQQHGQDVFVETVMRREFLSIQPSMPLEEVYKQLAAVTGGVAMIRTNEVIYGFVDMDNILEFILIRKADADMYTRRRKTGPMQTILNN